MKQVWIDVAFVLAIVAAVVVAQMIDDHVKEACTPTSTHRCE